METFNDKHPVADRVKSLPESPGVYIMKDKDGKVIYVGKAKSLRDRVRSYFNSQDTRAQIAFLLEKLVFIDTIVTESESQAFVLESDLIKKYKPRYNIRLKDDKAFLSVRIDYSKDYPRLELTRRIEQDGATYFGPYSYGQELRGILDLIKTVVPLRTCSDVVMMNRQRPCLEYEIKRCAGPCCLEVDKTEYRKWLRQAERILEGRAADIIPELTQKMERASEELRFEEAALYRDRINLLENFKAGRDLISYRGESRDVIGLCREGNLLAVAILHVRNGRIGGSQNFSLDNVVGNDEEVVQEILNQYYESAEIPEEILLPIEIPDAKLVENRIKTLRGVGAEILTPERGLKKRLLGIAELNAKQSFAEKFNAEERYAAAAGELAKLAGLSQMPRRIECLDISNLQGSNIVASIVCFQDGMPDKNSYKRYKLEFEGKPDDFRAMYEITKRRLERGFAEDNLPDLLVIDGGAGQLAAAIRARDEMRLNLEMISLAKFRSGIDQLGENGSKPERIFLPYKDESIVLPLGTPVLHLLERIRDEAHRFVITFHRSQRARRVFESALDNILGLGEIRKKRLLSIFGSVEALKKFSAEEISARGKVPLPVATDILKRIKD
jgi:excinuclease ABC subunit C